MASNQLGKKDYMKTFLRTYFLQNGFNYSNCQDPGHADVLCPAPCKVYKDDNDRLREVLKENVEFFNANIHFLSFITSLHLVMLENKTPSNEVRNIKMALVGPLIGVGDPLTQLCLALLFTVIGTPLTQDGLTIGPILFFVVMSMILLAMKLLTDMWGYKLDTNIIATPNTKMEQISNIASTIGVTVISGLTVNFVKTSTPIQYVANMPGDQQRVVAVQEMADAIAPKLLPVLFTGLILYLIKVKEWATHKLVILIIILGTVLSALNLIA